MEKENKAIKISLSTLFLILSIVVIIVMTYLVFKLYNEKVTENEKSIQLQIQVNNLNEKINSIYQTTNSNISAENISSKLINFDRKNCINNSKFSDSNYEIGRFGISESLSGLWLNIASNNEKNVTIQVRYDIMFPGKYSEDEIIKGTVKHSDEIELKFDKKVESMFGGVFGPDLTQDMVYLFLLEDGTLEYMKCSDIYNFKKYEHKPVNGVNDIVKFDNVTLNPKDNSSQYTVIAYKIDGTYYDLSDFIKLDL